jgi:hypothetical protein
LLIALTLQFQGKRRAGISTVCPEQYNGLYSVKITKAELTLEEQLRAESSHLVVCFLVRSERNRKDAVFKSI